MKILIDKAMAIVKHILSDREIKAYLVCGLLTTILAYALYMLLSILGQNVFWSNTYSSAVALVFAFIVNKKFVFLSHEWHIKTLLTEVLKFGAGRFATYVMETVLLILLIEYMSLPEFLCKGFTMSLVIVGNYVISKLIVFRKKKI